MSRLVTPYLNAHSAVKSLSVAAKTAANTPRNMTAPSAVSRDHEEISMGDVAVLLKILPTDVELDINALKNEVVNKVKPLCEVNKVEIIEVGFGLKAIKLQVIVPDQEGKIDQVEQTISGVEGVGQVDTEEVTLV